MPDSGSEWQTTPLRRARLIAGATMLVLLVVGLDLLVGSSPSRRSAGECMLGILAIAIVGMAWSGRRPRVMASWLLIMSLGQGLFLAWMLLHDNGALLVTAMLNGLFLAAWLLAAAFAWRAASPGSRAGPTAPRSGVR